MVEILDLKPSLRSSERSGGDAVHFRNECLLCEKLGLTPPLHLYVRTSYSDECTKQHPHLIKCHLERSDSQPSCRSDGTPDIPTSACSCGWQRETVEHVILE